MRRFPVPSDPTKTNILINHLLTPKTDKVLRLMVQGV